MAAAAPGAAPASPEADDRRVGRPVLYLDLDDTVLSYATGEPHAAPGAAAFLRWVLDVFEVRWLTRWCPDGEMPDGLIDDLWAMTGLPRDVLRGIRGFDWRSSESKLNGIAWLEHAVLARPFLWIEDEYGVGEFERTFLARHGFEHAYRHCNVTTDPIALARLHAALLREGTPRATGPTNEPPPGGCDAGSLS